MKVTIAGANSFIGKRMVAIAKNQPDIELILIVRPGSSVECPEGAKIITCNMEDYEQLGNIAGNGDVFIDLPWLGSRGADRQNPEMQKFNYECNMAAMKSMADAGYKVLISAGSQAEYGQCHGYISEETPLNANTEYGKYKVQIFRETTELAEKYGIRFIEPRYFSLYGPGDYEKTLIMSCIDKMKRNVDVDLNECTQLWDYLYVDDAVEGVFSLCRNEKAEGAYNFATGHYRQLKDFVMDIHEAIGSQSRVRFGVVEYNGLYIDLQPVVDRLKTDAAWEYRTSFIDGIKKAAGLLAV
ncbi:MAG: NAD-dependent epimerase/dehydratase family protein [Lachnospiraceae bacterium]|nr:NAD-dependent epimerase/dehydratase family protein [Lachnospiraceae bacterium]